MKKIILAVVMVAGVAFADPPKSIKSDFADMGQNPLALQVYQNNQKTYTLQFFNNNSALNCTSYDSLFYIAPSITAPASTALTAWVDISNGICSVTLTPAQLATVGKWIYGCGLISGGSNVTLSMQGSLTIVADPNGR